MAITLAPDFKELLKSLASNSVDYLLIGGYAVGVYGFTRETNDLAACRGFLAEVCPAFDAPPR